MKKNTSPKSKGTTIKLVGINHFGLNVRNMAKAEAFYTGILGFPVIMRTQTQAGLQHVEVDAGNVAIALFESPELDLTAAQKTMTDDGYLHFAFGAPYDRFDATLQALKEGGVEMDGEPRDWGNGISIYFHDPDGHQIEIHFDK
ncbi:MAG: VOC family protein [Nitrospinae bacterium]|nr:VOC family protein [Nitrospinota bacterium]MCH7651845.1 VOC family protein [Nitrospinota bacterium]MCH8933124.1 VOC family protein [Nitrospinota bacterium]